jgi:hypothetical protein
MSRKQAHKLVKKPQTKQNETKTRDHKHETTRRLHTAPVHVVAQEEVVPRRRIAAHLKQLDQVVELAVDVATKREQERKERRNKERKRQEQ